jgi:hypothetical protein
MYKIQSILFPLRNYTIQKALHFLRQHNYNSKKVDRTPNFLRFRQLDPTYLYRQGYNKVVNKKLPNGVELVIFYKEKIGRGRDDYYDESYSTIPYREKKMAIKLVNDYIKSLKYLLENNGIPEDKKNKAITKIYELEYYRDEVIPKSSISRLKKNYEQEILKIINN